MQQLKIENAFIRGIQSASN